MGDHGLVDGELRRNAAEDLAVRRNAGAAEEGLVHMHIHEIAQRDVSGQNVAEVRRAAEDAFLTKISANIACIIWRDAIQ